MKKLLLEIGEELRLILKGETLDSVLPPVLFLLIFRSFGLAVAAVVSIGTVILLLIRRLIRGQNWKYALGGLAAAVGAGGYAILSGRASNYFIPDILGNGVILALSAGSLAYDLPLASVVSHISRGWELEWYRRDDVMPAYREVTWFWTAYFAVRLIVQLFLFFSGNTWGLAWASTLLGLPGNLLILVLSYIYGVWRLKGLGGPGVEELRSGKMPPWKGQTRGF